MNTGTSQRERFTAPPPGYRLPGDLRLGPVVLQVADIGRSRAFYRRVIGLETLDTSDGMAQLGAPASEEPLVVLHEHRGAAPVPRRGRLGLFHYAILLPDRAGLAAFVRHLQRIGVAAGMSDHLVSEAIYLSDPDGLGIEVYVDRPRSRWGVRDGMLQMGTLPLDLVSLLRAGGADAWDVAPPGTRIGHVHLHVGDLAQASAFYHDALGLDRVPLQYPGALFLSAGGYHHHLGTNTWAAGAEAAPPDDARLLEWTIRLPFRDSVNEAVRSLSSHGVAVRQDATDALATDPWGTTVRLTSASAQRAAPPAGVADA